MYNNPIAVSAEKVIVSGMYDIRQFLQLKEEPAETAQAGCSQKKRRQSAIDGLPPLITRFLL